MPRTPGDPAVFYVEKPLPVSKKQRTSVRSDESDHHQAVQRGKKTPTYRSAASGLGQKRGGGDCTSESRVPSVVDQAPEKDYREGSPQASPSPPGTDGPAKNIKDQGNRGRQGPGTYEEGSGTEAAQQSAPEVEGGTEGSGAGAGGKRNKAPLSEERKAQLEAARQRAVQVRKENAAVRKQERQLKQRADEEKRQEARRKQLEQEKAEQRKTLYRDSDVVPAPLPKKQPAKYVSPDYDGPRPAPVDVKDSEEEAFPPKVVELPEKFKKYGPVDSPVRAPPPEKPVTPPLDMLASGVPEATERKEVNKGGRFVPDPEDSDEAEERYLRKKRRELEKKRMLREEMEIDKAMMPPPVSRPHVPPVPAPGPKSAPDPIYKEHMERVKRAMLMDAIFGGK